MSSIVKEKNLGPLISIFLCFTAIYSVEGKGTLKGDNVTFSPLGEGANYTVIESTTGGWLLAGYHAVAESLLLSLKYLPPYDAIRETIRNMNGQGNLTTEEFIKETIGQNIPVTVLTSLSLVCALLLPLTGIIFGCCRCKGHCGGELIEGDMVLHPTKHRQRFTAAISVCSVLILVGAFSITIFNDKAENVVFALDSTLTGAINEITIYKDHSLSELNEVATENMNFTIDLITQEITNLPFNITKPLVEGGQETVSSLFEAVGDVGSSVKDLKDSLKAVADVVEQLRANGKTLRDGLQEARQSLTDAKAQCDSDPASVSAGACASIPAGDTLQADADYTKVPDAKQELSNIEAVVAGNDFEAESVKVREEFNLLPAKVNVQTLSGREEITNFTKELQVLTEDMMNYLKKSGDALQNNVLVPMKSEVQNIFGKRGILDRYSGYRWLTLLFVSLAVVFIALLTFMGLVSGAGVAVAEKLRSTATALNNLQNTIVTSEPLRGELITKSQKLMADNINTMNKVNKIDLLRGQLRSFLQGDGLRDANKAGEESLGRALGWMDQYLEDTINKLRNEVGDCQPIRRVYDVVVSSVCGQAVGLLNALWLSLGVISLFSVITIILCVRLAKHFRRAKSADDIFTEQDTSNYGVPLGIFDKFPKNDTEHFKSRSNQIGMEELLSVKKPVALEIRHRQPLAVTKNSVTPVVTDI